MTVSQTNNAQSDRPATAHEVTETLFRTYAHRLIAFTRVQMSPQLGQKMDPEDVVQSVFRSIVADQELGLILLGESGGLWSLLVKRTFNKLRSKIALYRADKRALTREESLREEAELLSREPRPDDALILTDEVSYLFRVTTNPRHHQVIELALQGCSAQEIAAKADYSETRVLQIFTEARQRLLKRERMSQHHQSAGSPIRGNDDSPVLLD